MIMMRMCQLVSEYESKTSALRKSKNEIWPLKTCFKSETKQLPVPVNSVLHAGIVLYLRYTSFVTRNEEQIHFVSRAVHTPFITDF